MESEQDPYQDLHAHLESREWHDVQIVNFFQQLAMGGLTRHIHAIHNLLKSQQANDEQVAAEKEFDRWAIARTFGKDYQPVDYEAGVYTPDEFRQTRRYQEAKDDAGWDVPSPYAPPDADWAWDETGKFLGDPESRDL